MTSLVDFLLAQIEADEQVAKAAALQHPGTWRFTDPSPYYAQEILCAGDGPVTADDLQEGGVTSAEAAEQIVLFQPARVLAECAAKRKTIEATLAWPHTKVEDCWYSCSQSTGDDSCCDDTRKGEPCDCGRDYHAVQVLGALAQVYSDRPGFDPAWGGQ